MPAAFFGVEQSTIRPALDQRRRSERRSCRLDVTLRTPGGDCHALLLDISAGGVGIRLDTLMRLRPGMTVSLVAPLLGQVTCVVRWAMPPLYGAEFTAAGHALTGVRRFYDSLPPAHGEMS